MSACVRIGGAGHASRSGVRQHCLAASCFRLTASFCIGRFDPMSRSVSPSSAETADIAHAPFAATGCACTAGFLLSGYGRLEPRTGQTKREIAGYMLTAVLLAPARPPVASVVLDRTYAGIYGCARDPPGVDLGLPASACRGTGLRGAPFNGDRRSRNERQPGISLGRDLRFIERGAERSVARALLRSGRRRSSQVEFPRFGLVLLCEPVLLRYRQPRDGAGWCSFLGPPGTGSRLWLRSRLS